MESAVVAVELLAVGSQKIVVPVVAGLSFRPGSPAVVESAAVQEPAEECPEFVVAELAVVEAIWLLDAVGLEIFFHL